MKLQTFKYIEYQVLTILTFVRLIRLEEARDPMPNSHEPNYHNVLKIVRNKVGTTSLKRPTKKNGPI